mmetsp:Transcript_64202/g.165258  ORF Transcript_64202/g.165258 Transcript_64202/m.165258 type:complete len:211 (+) Transcript_64202:428-1060(+)
MVRRPAGARVGPGLDLPHAKIRDRTAAASAVPVGGSPDRRSSLLGRRLPIRGRLLAGLVACSALHVGSASSVAVAGRRTSQRTIASPRGWPSRRGVGRWRGVGLLGPAAYRAARQRRRTTQRWQLAAEAAEAGRPHGRARQPVGGSGSGSRALRLRRFLGHAEQLWRLGRPVRVPQRRHRIALVQRRAANVYQRAAACLGSCQATPSRRR